MKIKDITEGWGNVAKGLAKDFVGSKNWNSTTEPFANAKEQHAQRVAQGQQQAAGQFKTNPSREAPVGYQIELSPENSVVKTKDGWLVNDDYLVPTNMPAHQQYEQFAKDGIHSYKDVEPTNPQQTNVPNPKEGSVLLVKAPNGEQYFKSYTGSWHVKGKLPTDFSAGGTKVTDPKDIAALDQLLPDAKLVGVKPDPRNPNGDSWIYDQRNTALMARRNGKE